MEVGLVIRGERRVEARGLDCIAKPDRECGEPPLDLGVGAITNVREQLDGPANHRLVVRPRA